MAGLISGIHHYSLKCNSDEQFFKAVSFYRDVLGLEIDRIWSEGIMFKVGDCRVEIFSNGTDILGQGSIRHIAFATKHVDECVETIRKAGYEITVEPKDVVIPSSPQMPARIAFCIGPVGEEIELFDEKSTKEKTHKEKKDNK